MSLPTTDKDAQTILVLAGDIGVGGMACKFIDKYSKRFKAIVYVAGNHEFYGKNIYLEIEAWRKRAESRKNVFFLENDVAIIDGVRFIGATMWTDINKGDTLSYHIAKMKMNDYKSIRTNGWRKGSLRRETCYLQPQHTIDMHKASVEYFDYMLQQPHEGKTVMVTHHCPHEVFLDIEKYGFRDICYAYYTEMDEFIQKHAPDFWIAGHTHKYVNEKIYGTHMLSNPRGYEGYSKEYLVEQFNKYLRVPV